MEIDIDRLVLKAASNLMLIENSHQHESVAIVKALQEQEPNIVRRVREQVKEYKRLTMWRE